VQERHRDGNEPRACARSITAADGGEMFPQAKTQIMEGKRHTRSVRKKKTRRTGKSRGANRRLGVSGEGANFLSFPASERDFWWLKEGKKGSGRHQPKEGDPTAKLGVLSKLSSILVFRKLTHTLEQNKPRMIREFEKGRSKKGLLGGGETKRPVCRLHDPSIGGGKKVESYARGAGKKGEGDGKGDRRKSIFGPGGGQEAGAWGLDRSRGKARVCKWN